MKWVKSQEQNEKSVKSHIFAYFCLHHFNKAKYEPTKSTDKVTLKVMLFTVKINDL